MVNYTVYRGAYGIYEDFDNEIDASRLLLSAKHFFVNGLEVAVECYYGSELRSGSQVRYNDQQFSQSHQVRFAETGKVREHLDMGQGDDTMIFKYHD